MVCPLGFGPAVSCKLSQCSTMRPFSKRKISKPILGPKNFVLGMGEHEVPVLECADGVHLRGSLGQLLQQLAKASEAVSRGEIVLDILSWD